ncbi:MAG TPA: hypothetical protein VGO05_01140, partial [Roseiarcus sp.]|nr:hypothetical protein [Roseiarcus sp.]
MSEHRRIWPLLVYGSLAAIAAVLRKDSRQIPENEGHGTLRKPCRIIYPAPDDTSGTSNETPSAPNLDVDKRPQEQVENDQPISAQMRRAKEPGRGRHAVVPWQIPWAGWKDILWRVYASV